MMRRALLLSVLFTSPAVALNVPTPGVKDDHYRTAVYDPQNRTALTLQQGMATNVTFDIMEHILRVILPDENGPVGLLKAESGNQTPLINNLPLFGQSPGRTNLIVITASPEGKERPYLFALTVIPSPKDGSDAPDATFGLTFTYPIQEREAKVQQAQLTWKQRQDAKAREIAEARLNTDVFYGTQNWKYLAQGQARDIVPIEAHDNGRLTAFRYPGNMAHPAVFIVPSSGLPDACTTGKSTAHEAPEQAISSTIVDDMIVVQRTAAHFRIRSGTEVAEVYNCGYDPIGVNPGTGTGSPDVIRRLVSQ